MLRKRIIFSLIYSDGFFMQSRNFRLQKVGNLNWLEKNYKFKEIAFSLDELVILNATRLNKSMQDFAKIIESLVNDVFIPIAAGGGIRSMEDAELLFKSGADKLVLNTLLYEDPELVRLLIKRYGSQSIIASIDYKINDENLDVYIKDGSVKIDLDLEQYLTCLEKLEVGEIYLNSIDRDGTGFGYDFNIIEKFESKIKIPLIIAGGAGNGSHFVDALKFKNVCAVATANLFNFIGDGLPMARNEVIKSGGNIINWNVDN